MVIKPVKIIFRVTDVITVKDKSRHIKHILHLFIVSRREPHPATVVVVVRATGSFSFCPVGGGSATITRDHSGTSSSSSLPSTSSLHRLPRVPYVVTKPRPPTEKLTSESPPSLPALSLRFPLRLRPRVGSIPCPCSSCDSLSVIHC